jgi:hypothetical protein
MEISWEYYGNVRWEYHDSPTTIGMKHGNGMGMFDGNPPLKWQSFHPLISFTSS